MPEDRDRKTVLDPWGTTVIEDYDRLCEEFGIQRFEPLLGRVPSPSMLMRRGVIFGHRDLERVLRAMERGEPFAVMSGIKSTGEFHLGTLMTAREIIYFQRQGAEAFYAIADVEAYEDNGIPLERSERYAVGNVADILALGFDPGRGYIYRQSRELRVKDLALLLGRGVTLATMKAIYGERHMGLYLSSLIQAGDILLPQLEEFGGPRPTVVPVGVDQDPHLRLCRDLAHKFRRKHGFVRPSSTYHRQMRGLDGSPKMSKRNPMSYFTFQESLKEIARKISEAFTGGRPTVREQRELGGVPEICPVYEMCVYHFTEDDGEVRGVYHDCKTGKLLCGEHKERVIEAVLGFVREHRRRRRGLIDKAREILQVT